MADADVLAVARARSAPLRPGDGRTASRFMPAALITALLVLFAALAGGGTFQASMPTELSLPASANGADAPSPSRQRADIADARAIAILTRAALPDRDEGSGDDAALRRPCFAPRALEGAAPPTPEPSNSHCRDTTIRANGPRAPPSSV